MQTYLPTPSPARSNRALSPVEVNGGEEINGRPIAVDEDDVVRPQEKKRKIEPEVRCIGAILSHARLTSLVPLQSDSDSLSTADSVLASAATASASVRDCLSASGPSTNE